MVDVHRQPVGVATSAGQGCISPIVGSRHSASIPFHQRPLIKSGRAVLQAVPEAGPWVFITIINRPIFAKTGISQGPVGVDVRLLAFIIRTPT